MEFSHVHSVSLCSSLDNGANNCKTETTQIEADSSLFLEITPPDVEEDGTKLKVVFFSVIKLLTMPLNSNIAFD